MRSDPKPSLNRFLADVERRALVMAELSTRNREDALDLVQDAMLGFVRRYARKPAAEWPPLFHRVLQNKIRDWGRRTQVQRRWRVWLHGEADSSEGADRLQTLPDPSGLLPEDVVGNQAAMQDLVDAVGGLPERQREVVILRIWEGLDVAETARAMGCSAGSVKTHLSRGLARLRDCLEASR